MAAPRESETASPSGPPPPSRLRRLLTFPRRRPILFVILVALIALAITPTVIVTRTFFIAHAAAMPNALPGKTWPDVQTDPAGCGAHSIHAVYRAYGLDVDRENVRWRLGIDTKAVFWLGTSTGTLHPDMYMVLRQDGFDVQSMELGLDRSHDEILQHVDSGHLLILLIQRRQNGHLHWVAVDGREGDDYLVYDSLEKVPYRETREFTDRFVVTAFALQPSGELRTGLWESIGHLLDGSKELGRFRDRMKQLGDGGTR